MLKKEREIVIGCILGDGFIQKTGKKNARLRLEHSVKQKDYIFWKWKMLKRYMQDKPKMISRFNPIWQKKYDYYRCQTHSSPQFGKLHQMFYANHQKQIPLEIKKLLTSLVLAIWFMDDGYYYKRDKTAYIYLSPLPDKDIKRLQDTLKENFCLTSKLEKKKTGALNFKFSVIETKKLVKIIAPHIIPSMRYKINEEPRID